MLNLVGVVPVDQVRKALLDWITNEWAGGSIAVGLYQNNLTPNPGTVFADITIATFDGYAPLTLPAGNYGVPNIMPDGSAIDIPTVTLTFTDSGALTPNTIYGMYFNDGDGNLLGILRFDTPKIMNALGKFITIEMAVIMPALAPAVAADVTSNG